MTITVRITTSQDVQVDPEYGDDDDALIAKARAELKKSKPKAQATEVCTILPEDNS